MIAMQLSEAARATEAVLRGADVPFTGVSTDSRTLEAGALFCALRGPNFDGHDHCAAAAGRGAVALVVEHSVDTALPSLLVRDTKLALGALAHAWRTRFSLPVVGITGSNGKTTVKQMLAAILGVDHRVLATAGNLNNEIGVPQTLFRLDASHAYAVIEMGASHPGDISQLVGIAAPHVGVVTLCAPAHLEGFGSIECVAQTKGEIYAGLGPDGIAVINADDDFAAYWAGVAGDRRTIRFGQGMDADVRAGDVEMLGLGRGMRFTLHAGTDTVPIDLPFDGMHNVMNALAAAAAARALGIPLHAIRTGLGRAQHADGRLNVVAGLRGARIIDDTYNANPASLRAALAVLAATPGEKWVVLGDMGELGDDAAGIHESIGREARDIGIDRLYTLGPLAAAAARGFGEHACDYADAETLRDALAGALHEDVTVLVKGSRFMRMERVCEALTGAHKPC